MNFLLGRPNGALRAKFKKAFQSGSDIEIFDFLYRYMNFVEDYNDAFVHLFLLNEKPLAEKHANDKLMEEFNEKCLSFLKNIIKSKEKARSHDFMLFEAKMYMGLAYEFGLFGLSEDKVLAINYYSAAARERHPIGVFRTGQCLEKGVGKPKNYKHALNFYRCSAKLGYVVGMHIYGSILLYGDLDCERDVQTGLFYLKLAVKKADKSYPFPYYDLAQVYETKVEFNEVHQDDEYAFRMYLKGANLGCPNCRHRVAKCYEVGELGQKRNDSFAVDWYKKASLSGHMDAQMIYSRFLFTGMNDILEKNQSGSFFWALKAATRGHSQAALSVAELTEEGLGTKKSTFLALWWYTVAYEFGNTQSEENISRLRLQIDTRNEGTKESTYCCICFCV